MSNKMITEDITTIHTDGQTQQTLVILQYTFKHNYASQIPIYP